MVDYNNEATVTTPPSDILKISILERRALFINALEKYNELAVKTNGGYTGLHNVVSYLQSYYLEVYTGMNDDSNKIEPKDKERLDKIFSYTGKPAAIEELLECFKIIERFVYNKKLTKFDTREDYDKWNIELSNKRRGH